MNLEKTICILKIFKKLFLIFNLKNMKNFYHNFNKFIYYKTLKKKEF